MDFCFTLTNPDVEHRLNRTYLCFKMESNILQGDNSSFLEVFFYLHKIHDLSSSQWFIVQTGKRGTAHSMFSRPALPCWMATISIVFFYALAPTITGSA